MGHLFRPPGFGTITMHTGITGITELAVKSDYDSSTSQHADQMFCRVNAGELSEESAPGTGLN